MDIIIENIDMDILDSHAMPTVILNLNLNLSYNDCSLIFVAVYTQMRCQPFSTSSPPYRKKTSFLVGHKLNFLRKNIFIARKWGSAILFFLVKFFRVTWVFFPGCGGSPPSQKPLCSSQSDLQVAQVAWRIPQDAIVPLNGQISRWESSIPSMVQ